MIGLQVEIILDGYWKDRPSDVVKAGILADWMDALQDWHLDQIKECLREWRNNNPNKKPNPGHILSRLKERRGLVHVSGPKRDPLFDLNRGVPQIAGPV